MDCDIVGGSATATLETFDPRFWPVDDLPPLSASRVTQRQLGRLLHLHRDPVHPAAFD